jgi:hypothetical protein
MSEVYEEGICRGCGQRVTVDSTVGGRRKHMRDGEPCGPVEIDNPFDVRDQTWPGHWKVPRAEGR